MADAQPQPPTTPSRVVRLPERSPETERSKPTTLDTTTRPDADTPSLNDPPSSTRASSATETYTRWLRLSHPKRYLVERNLRLFVREQEQLQTTARDSRWNYMVGDVDDLSCWQMARLSRDIEVLEEVWEFYRKDAVMAIRGRTARKVRAAWEWRVELGSAQDPGGGRE